MVRVLFVCMGNICRSPMAEGIFRALASEAGLLDTPNGIETDSAGTIGYHAGEAPDPRAIAQAKSRGIDISNQRARQVQPEDFETFDYVIALDRDNYNHLEDILPPGYEDRLSLMLSHAERMPLDEVPDPYWGGDDGFVRCFDLIEAGAQGLLKSILRTHYRDHAQPPS